MKKVPVTLYGQRVGWAVENDGKIDMKIDDEEAIRWITDGLTTGLSIDENRYDDGEIFED